MTIWTKMQEFLAKSRADAPTSSGGELASGTTFP
jgi:hypothetical protein